MSIKAIEILNKREEIIDFIELRTTTLVQKARLQASQVQKKKGYRMPDAVPDKLEHVITGNELTIRVVKAREYAVQCQQKVQSSLVCQKST